MVPPISTLGLLTELIVYDRRPLGILEHLTALFVGNDPLQPLSVKLGAVSLGLSLPLGARLNCKLCLSSVFIEPLPRSLLSLEIRLTPLTSLVC